MKFVALAQDQPAMIYQDGVAIDLVIVREVEDDGYRITTQSERYMPGTMDEFMYLPEGTLELGEEKLHIETPGWRLLFWSPGRPEKCINPYGPIYDIRPTANVLAPCLRSQ